MSTAFGNQGRTPLDEAYALYQAGKIGEAGRRCQAILEKQPDNGRALHLMALLLQVAGHADKALPLLANAARLRPGDSDIANNFGNALLNAGQAQEAVEAFRRALEANPKLHQAENNLGNALQALGRHAEALECYDRALVLQKKFPEAHLNKGNALLKLGRFAEAVAAYDAALKGAPKMAAAQVQRGVALQRLGRLDEALKSLEAGRRNEPGNAVAAMRHGQALAEAGRPGDAEKALLRALELEPKMGEARTELARLYLQLQRPEDALREARAAVEAAPNAALALLTLGSVCHQTGRTAEAIELAGRITAARPEILAAQSLHASALLVAARYGEAVEAARAGLLYHPDCAQLHYTLAGALLKLGKVEEAEATLRGVLEKAPSAETWNELGEVFREQTRFADAEAAYRESLKVSENANAYSNLGVVVRHLGRAAEAEGYFARALELQPGISAAIGNLASLYFETGRREKGMDAYRTFRERAPGNPAALSNLLYHLHFDPAIPRETVFAEHGRFETLFASKVAPLAAPENVRDAERVLRVGFVSSDFREHSVAYFLEGLFEHADRRRMMVLAYSDTLNTDAVTERLRSRVDGWCDSRGLNDAELAERVRGDGVDVWVDLAGHTAGCRLLAFARRPAPVQVSWLGYPDTTGTAAVGWRISDEVTEPAGDADRFSTERLLRLPDGFHCYRAPECAPDVVPLPALKAGAVTFGSFNNIVKLTPETVALWAKVLLAVPGSRLVLKTGQAAEEVNTRRIRGWFAEHGVAEERVTLLPRTATTREHLSCYGEVDIALDPFPYNGTTTTCEALWMGVPVLALLGDRHCSRVTASLVGRVGLGDWVAATPEAFVALAAAKAGAVQALAALRSGLREQVRRSPLCDERGFAQAFEAGLRSAWRAWCTGAVP